jgi:hypothetical protein
MEGQPLDRHDESARRGGQADDFQAAPGRGRLGRADLHDNVGRQPQAAKKSPRQRESADLKHHRLTTDQ